MSDGPARVLEALRRSAGRPCSGESLSRELGVTRAQVWKHVEALRGRGYQVDGAPGGGYRLTGVPDRLYPEEVQRGLDTRWLARAIHYLDSTDSTNRVALELGRAGAAHGTTVIAEAQTAGRGRLGRSFFSPPGCNLYTSVVLRPELTTAQAPSLILSAGAAVAEAVAASVPDPGAVEIKWPNDVLLGGRKTCGILMELSAEAARVSFAVLGIGVNLNLRSEELPEALRATATNLRAHTGAPLDRAAFARRLYGTLEDLLDAHVERGFEGVRPRFEAHFHMAGRRVEVSELSGAVLRGTVLGVDADGALRVRREDDGGVVRVVAGDVTLAERRSAR